VCFWDRGGGLESGTYLMGVSTCDDELGGGTGCESVVRLLRRLQE
jgi:hypothetical protein